MTVGCVLGVLGGGLRAETVTEIVDTDKYVVTVPAEETYTLTAADAAAAAGCTVIKAGEGTVVGNADFAAFAGDIHITNGVWRYTAKGGLGADGGETRVYGAGTLENRVDASVEYTAAGGNPSLGVAEKVFVEGTGFQGKGALWNRAYSQNIAHRLTLTGDTLFTGDNGKSLQARYAVFNMNGHKLTVDGPEFLVVATGGNFTNMGDIEVVNGAAGFNDELTTGSAARTFTFGTGTQFSMWRLQSAMLPKLVFAENSRLYSNYDGGASMFTLGGNGKANRWAGEVVLNGTVKNTLERNVGMTFSGLVSGAGGFVGGKGGWLQLGHENNTFAGGVAITGAAGVPDTCVTGGVAVLAHGAVPVDGAPLVLTNACLLSYTSLSNVFPDVCAHGQSVISGRLSVAKCTLKSLTKTGGKTLTLFGQMHVLGDTDIREGTVRFGSRVPAASPGLAWYYRWPGNDGTGWTTVPAAAPFMKYDIAGASYAYQAWRATSGADGANTHNQAHYYTGYIRVPGEEGADVTCNFVSSICRSIRLIIGGTTVVRMSDRLDELTNVTLPGWGRLYVGPPVTLKAGWQKLYLYMGNSWNGMSGPNANTDLGWVANFGVGVDWQARCVTNAANYVKLLDPGDGSFLRTSMDTKENVDPARFRPVFGGAVKFGPGAELDVNDAAPYTPVVFPSLTGVPTLRNGAVRVTSGVWTLRAGDVAGGVPLTVTAGASLTFAAGATFTVETEELPVPAARTYPLLRVAEGGTLVNPPVFARPEGCKWFAEWSADGRALDLVYREGMAIILK